MNSVSNSETDRGINNKPASRSPRRIALAALLTGALLPAAGAQASEANWQLHQEKDARGPAIDQEKDGIAVYTRPVADSPFLQVKGTVALNSPAARVSELMGDGNGCAQWRTTCKSSTVLEQVSDAERYIYLVLDLPWPAADRDLVMHSKTVVDAASQTATVELVSDSSRHPAQDYVRAESQGKFVIRAVGEDRVEFTYIMHTDLGGDLPPRAVNSRLAETTLDELIRLRKLAEG